MYIAHIQVLHRVGEGGACLHAEACLHISLFTKLCSILFQNCSTEASKSSRLFGIGMQYMY